MKQGERAKNDPDYQWLVGGIQEFEEVRSRNTVSLNVDVRREERKQELERRLQRENERRKALNLEPLESLDDIDDDELPDVLLRQAADIVSDMAEMRSVKRVPAQTASVD